MMTVPHHMEVYVGSGDFDFCGFIRLVDEFGFGENKTITQKLQEKELDFAEMWGPKREVQRDTTEQSPTIRQYDYDEF